MAMKLGSIRLSSAFLKGKEQNKAVRCPAEKNERKEGKREEGGKQRGGNQIMTLPAARTLLDDYDVDEIPVPFLFLA